MRGAVNELGAALPYAAKAMTAASVGLVKSMTSMPTCTGTVCRRRPSSSLRASRTCKCRL